MESLTVIDVGHGSCTVLESGDNTVVIDTAGKTHLQQFLALTKITKIDLVIISHTDADHIRGLINLLSNENYQVIRIVINQDSSKKSTLWEDARFLIDDLVRRTELQFETGISYGKTYNWAQVNEKLLLEFSSPNTAMILTGPGLSLPKTKTVLTSNSVSIVVRVLYNCIPLALITGDMDRIALDEIIKHAVPVNARYLIFPHHGGLPGTDDVSKFTSDLLDIVKPESIVFSNGRGSYGTPRPEIIATALDIIPTVNISCTQLAVHCCAQPMARIDYSPSSYSAGKEAGTFCAGSIEIDLETGQTHPDTQFAHANFVKGLPLSLCSKNSA